MLSFSGQARYGAYHSTSGVKRFKLWHESVIRRLRPTNRIVGHRIALLAVSIGWNYLVLVRNPEFWAISHLQQSKMVLVSVHLVRMRRWHEIGVRPTIWTHQSTNPANSKVGFTLKGMAVAEASTGLV